MITSNSVQYLFTGTHLAVKLQ